MSEEKDAAKDELKAAAWACMKAGIDPRDELNDTWDGLEKRFEKEVPMSKCVRCGTPTLHGLCQSDCFFNSHYQDCVNGWRSHPARGLRKHFPCKCESRIKPVLAMSKLVVEVLHEVGSKDALGGMSLTQIDYECMNGSWSMRMYDLGPTVKLNREQADKACEEQHTDPSFFFEEEEA